MDPATIEKGVPTERDERVRAGKACASARAIGSMLLIVLVLRIYALGLVVALKKWPF
jgi:hypothetical protein